MFLYFFLFVINFFKILIKTGKIVKLYTNCYFAGDGKITFKGGYFAGAGKLALKMLFCKSRQNSHCQFYMEKMPVSPYQNAEIQPKNFNFF